MITTTLSHDDCLALLPLNDRQLLYRNINKSRVKAKLAPVTETDVKFTATVVMHSKSLYPYYPRTLETIEGKLKELETGVWSDFFNIQSITLSHEKIDNRRTSSLTIATPLVLPPAYGIIKSRCETQCKEALTQAINNLVEEKKMAEKANIERAEREVQAQKRRAEEEAYSKQQALERIPEDIARSLHLPRATTELMIDLIRSIQKSETISEEDRDGIMTKFKDIVKAQKEYHNIRAEVMHEIMPHGPMFIPFRGRY